MSVYTEQQIKDAFSASYYNQHKTYVGVRDAYEWWKNPLQKCIQLDAARGRKRCRTICEHCRKHANGLSK